MPIEYVTHPRDLTEWKPEDQPFYLEVYGETRPQLTDSETVAATQQDSTGTAPAPAPIYEYSWTIGHHGHPRHDGRLDFLHGSGQDFWAEVDDRLAARVYMFFPIDKGWRVHEVGASLRYLDPAAHQESFAEKAAKGWQSVQPFVETASQLARAVPGGGTAAAAATNTLGALAQLKLNSIPPGDAYAWSAGKMTFVSSYGAMQGVVWQLPRNVFTELGGRITGSLAVSFIRAAQQSGDPADAPAEPTVGQIATHAVVYGPRSEDRPDGQVWVPGEREFLHLHLLPELST